MNYPMFERPHPAIRSWAQFVLTIIIGAVGFVAAAEKVQLNQETMQKSVDSLSADLKDLSRAVNRNATATERLDEHMRAVDHRLDQLEKIEGEWRRPR